MYIPQNHATDTEQQAMPQATTMEPFVPQGGASTVPMPRGEGGYVDEGWSWGGFGLNFFFLIAVRKYAYLFVLLLMFVPLVNFLVLIGGMIFLGMNGRELARKSPTFSNHEQYLGFMKGVDHAGKICFYFYIGIAVIGIVASIVLASLGSARDRARNAEFNSQQQAAEMQYQLEMEDSM